MITDNPSMTHELALAAVKITFPDQAENVIHIDFARARQIRDFQARPKILEKLTEEILR